MMTKRLMVRGLTLALTLNLLIVLLLCNIEAVAFDVEHYRGQFAHLDRPGATGMSQEELVRVTGEIWSYLRGQRGNLQLTALVDGQRLPVFDQREQDHMVDVRVLFQRGYFLRNVGLVLLPILLITAVLLNNNHRLDRGLALILNRAGMGSLLILLAVGILVYYSFDSWFDRFHLLFFPNDLWQLDPSRHNLIKMFPLDFFFNTTIKFVGRSLLQLAIITAGSGWYLVWKRGKGSR